MPPRNTKPGLLSAMLAASSCAPCRAFASPLHLHVHLHVQGTARGPPPRRAISDADAGDGRRTSPRWVPWEVAELAADALRVTGPEFARTRADAEAYTSCDDEGDGVHECDFFGDYLGPTRWLHLTAAAYAAIDAVHFRIWEDVWSRPHAAVETADRVSKDCLRCYNDFMLEPRTSSVACPTDRPLVRVKVVPASFGLEGLEDALWEATEDLLAHSEASWNAGPGGARRSSRGEGCTAITFVAAAPDEPAEATRMEGDGEASSPSEFAPEQFREFAAAVREKMELFSRAEGVPLNDTIELTPLHPVWKLNKEADGDAAGASFPYPCVAVSTKIAA